MSCRRPSNASSSVTGPGGPVSGRLAATSTMGSRRRSAAIASPSRVCAFSRTRNAASWASKAPRSVTGGSAAPPALRVPGSSLVIMGSSSGFRLRGFGEPLDHGQAPVPLGGDLGHGPGGLVEALGLHLAENLPALLAPA